MCKTECWDINAISAIYFSAELNRHIQLSTGSELVDFKPGFHLSTVMTAVSVTVTIAMNTTDLHHLINAAVMKTPIAIMMHLPAPATNKIEVK